MNARKLHKLKEILIKLAQLVSEKRHCKLFCVIMVLGGTGNLCLAFAAWYFMDFLESIMTEEDDGDDDDDDDTPPSVPRFKQPVGALN